MKEILISFKSGHYKKIRGEWKGDSVWGHFVKPDGTEVHINKEEVEYIQVSPYLPGIKHDEGLTPNVNQYVPVDLRGK